MLTAHLPEMELKIPPTKPQTTSTPAFQLTVTHSEVPGTVLFHITPSSQEGMEKKTRRPYMRFSQKRDNANAAHVQTKIILENAGSSLGAICSAHRRVSIRVRARVRVKGQAGWVGAR